MAASSPDSILIVGSGVFGLSTAYSLAQNPHYSSSTISVLDRSPFPSPDGSSIDTSRIIRADYSDPAYAALAAKCQEEWRKQGEDDLGGEGRYTESGLALVANRGEQGESYVRSSFANIKSMMEVAGDLEGFQELSSKELIEQCVGTGGGTGSYGYINRRSGWADAEASMKWLRRKVEALGRVRFQRGEASQLIKEGRTVVGVQLKDGKELRASLVVLATGAWTGKLVDLRGRAAATGQVLVYMDITKEEQEKFGKMPTLLNLSNGLFIIPPANKLLKIARHGYGYSNPVQIPNPNDPSETIEVSLPKTVVDDPTQVIPQEGEADCRAALRQMIPSLGDRPFRYSRICWYTDTPKGDFIITYHPDFDGLFLATGGSGHGFKFLPSIGDKIVDCIEGNCPSEFKEKWAWPKEMAENVVTEDGSRGGKSGLILDVELKKGSKL
ncbi:fructosyl-amino acid oxidase [Phlyctema vagabunda]|uniref:Fructosyl-amino acid oxidase n=1 Tax=Phlyctema vagabunda TaxID=108571 RepID=A0ABR4PCL9_9HELO